MREAFISILCLILLISTMVPGCLDEDRTDENVIPRTFDIRNHTIHDRTEGVIVPIKGEGLVLERVDMVIRPSSWWCMVENFDFHINSSYTISNPSSEKVTARLGFPCTSHVLLGDHDEGEDIDVIIDGSKIEHKWAFNDDIFYHPSLLDDINSTEEINGRYMIFEFDNRIAEFAALYDISPPLHNEGVEFLAHFDIEIDKRTTIQVDIDFTHFSGFHCRDDCDFGRGHFRFDLKYEDLWKGAPYFDISIIDHFEPDIATSLERDPNGSDHHFVGNDTSLPLDIRIRSKYWIAEGYTYDEWGDVLPRVLVTCEETGTNTTSDETGYFYLEIGYSPWYRIIFRKEGYAPDSMDIMEFPGKVYLKNLTGGSRTGPPP